MKLIYLLLLFIISCSSNKDSKVNLESFINQGKKITIVNSENILKKEIKSINQLNIKNNSVYRSWNQKNYNNSNNIKSSFVEVTKKNKSMFGDFISMISYNDKIITIDKKSNVEFFSLDLKKLSAFKIYKKKIYKNYNIHFNLIAYKNKLLISDNVGNIHCYNLENLKLVWKQNLGVPFKSNIKIYKNKLYLVNSNSKIFSIDVSTGKIYWSFETASKNIKGKGAYQIAINDNKLYFTNDNAEIYCLDLEKNTLKWSLVFETKNYINKPLTFESSPIVIDNKNIFLSTNYGFLYSMNAESGSVNWSKAIPSTNKILIQNNYIILTTDNRFIVMNKSNGKLIYNQKIKVSKNDQNINFTDLLIGKNQILFFAEQGRIVSYNLNNLNEFNVMNFNRNYKDYIVSNRNLYIITENSISKY